jgi:hypothetical protein
MDDVVDRRAVGKLLHTVDRYEDDLHEGKAAWRAA